MTSDVTNLFRGFGAQRFLPWKIKIFQKTTKTKLQVSMVDFIIWTW